MATERKKSFKDKAKEKLGFGTKNIVKFTRWSRPWNVHRGNLISSCVQLLWSDDETNDGTKSKSMDNSGTHHGMMNPLAWDNLSTDIRNLIADDEKRREFRRSNSADSADSGGHNNATAATGHNNHKKLCKQITRPAGCVDYEVKSTDTLAKIAALFDTTPSELAKLNRLSARIVFQGQILYIPDKEGELLQNGSDSQASTPTSPIKVTPQPAAIVETPPLSPISPERRAPGLAERMSLPNSPTIEDDHLTPRPLSDDEAKRLDRECHERFIKLNVKHITDGLGVVAGVLLVTPNAIMFDPNVSDPLVIEHSADMYGMIAPLDTVISVAMYHDIAAMKLKSAPKELQQNIPKPEVYHTKDCPVAQARLERRSKRLRDASESSSDASDLLNVIAATAPTLKCSCTEENLAAMAAAAADTSREDEFAMNSSGINSSGFNADVSTSSSCRRDSDSNGVALATSMENFVLQDVPKSKKTQSKQTDFDRDNEDSSVFAGSAMALAETALSSSATAAIEIPDGGRDNDGDELTLKTGSVESGIAEMEGETERTNAVVSERIGNITYFQYDDKADDATKQTSVSAATEDSELGSPSATAEPTQITGAANRNKGFTGSALSSISPKVSSFAGSFVDFSSGLFSKVERDEVKDITEVEQMNMALNEGETSGNTTWYHRPLSLVSDTVSAGVNAVSSAASSAASVASNAASSAATKASNVMGASMDRDDSAPTSTTKRTVELEVESIVKLEDKPELFQSIDEIIPRPARQYEDPPLYLCLKVGMPINKTVSATCPIESYTRKKKKPEYWFSIPREKVDYLYAFFIQWSPDLYGGEDDIDPSERGFVVIDDDDDEDEEICVELIDELTGDVCHIPRSVSKDWEIVNVEEARRRMSILDVEDSLPLPELLGDTTVLSEEHVRSIVRQLPARAEGYPWTLIYSSDQNGFSLKTLYRSMCGFDTPVLLVIKDTNNRVFGALTSCSLKMSEHFYGTGESFIYTFNPEFRVYPWTGENNFFIKGNRESLAMGAGSGSFGLWLDGDIYHGRSQKCETYDNDPLPGQEDFIVKAFEAWGFFSDL
ncbi:oxidation resistance protein 1-like [Tubulanus polymorphus]|uniref:oxidation resistance protein 1-like n=1 Tax=Tubulanus polymorphus TaxID=672921 RepID=UPI003DA2B747